MAAALLHAQYGRDRVQAAPFHHVYDAIVNMDSSASSSSSSSPTNSWRDYTSQQIDAIVRYLVNVAVKELDDVLVTRGSSYDLANTVLCADSDQSNVNSGGKRPFVCVCLTAEQRRQPQLYAAVLRSINSICNAFPGKLVVRADDYNSISSITIETSNLHTWHRLPHDPTFAALMRTLIAHDVLAPQHRHIEVDSAYWSADAHNPASPTLAAIATFDALRHHQTAAVA